MSYSRAYQGQTLNLLSVIMKRVSMYYCRYRLTSWHVVISVWEVKDSVKLSNCQRYDQEHNRGEKKARRVPPLSTNEQILDVQKKNIKSSKEIVLSWTSHIESLSCQASHSVPSFKGKLIQKGAVTCLSFFDCFLPQASTFSPPWQCFFLSGFIQNSITFKEGSAKEMGRSLNTLRGLDLAPRNASLPLTFARKQF